MPGLRTATSEKALCLEAHKTASRLDVGTLLVGVRLQRVHTGTGPLQPQGASTSAPLQVISVTAQVTA